MPRPEQERIYMEAANNLLGNLWNDIVNRESPDFSALRADTRIGIEVTTIYRSGTTERGSPAKARESVGARELQEIAREYYSNGGSPISVQVLGSISAKHARDTISSCLRNHRREEAWNRKKYSLDHGIKLYVTDIPEEFPDYERWELVDDHVGHVSTASVEDLQAAIDKKGSRLRSYLQKFQEIDLLIVADRMYRSGKLLPPESPRISNPGFANIYFLSYPDEIAYVDCQ